MSVGAADREGFAAFLLRMRARGVVAKKLIAAVEAVPRRNFVAPKWHAAIWSQRMIPIDCGEALEGLDLQARIIDALALEDHHKVLEIGTGSGYTAALMSGMVSRLISVDRYKTLVDQARHRLEVLGISNVIVRQADAAKGLAGEGPFDRIVAWGSFESLPRAFVDQLSSNGLMIAPIGPADGEQKLARLSKVGSRFDREDIGSVRLQPLIPGAAAMI
jgi:protein-L-isoaspartate(D-aspartate) O-methyltransferase